MTRASDDRTEALEAVAKAAVRGHAYEGLCPDDVNGWESLDTNSCTLCKTLARLDAQPAEDAPQEPEPEEDGGHPAENVDDARAVAAEQAEDEALWLLHPTASEAYLIQALRRIHAAVEGGA